MKALSMKISSLLIVFIAMTAIEGCSYAKLDSGHTMCIFKPRMCPGKMHIKSGGLGCMDKEIILMVHNQLRQKLALGRVKSQPAALNMQTMVWNDELATVAQRWADQCRPGHDKSRNIGPFTVGQNVAAVWTYERNTGSQPDFPTQIEAWFDEVVKQGFSKANIEPFRYSKVAGHYTQLAWADTYLVGCGFTYYFDKEIGHTKLYVCNYAPGGNVVGGSMYKMGFTGGMYCDSYGLKSSDKMQGLCERTDGMVSYNDQCAKEATMGSRPKMHISMKEPSPSMLPPPPMMTMHPHMAMMMMMMSSSHNQNADANPNRFMSHGMPMPSKNSPLSSRNKFETFDNRLPSPNNKEAFDPFNIYKRFSR